MKTESEFKPLSGYLMLLIGLLTIVSIVVCILNEIVLPIAPLALILALIVKGIMIVDPNESMVLVLFGTYKGTVKDNGFFWVNPFFYRRRISLKARNLNGTPLKVNDKIGNPIEIAAVIVWQVRDTFKAAFEVDDYVQYVHIQSEASVRHLAGICPYDNFEDEGAEVTLRGGREM